MPKFKDLTEMRYGLLTVKRLHLLDPKKGAKWLCLCDCGGQIITFAAHLKNASAKTCGGRHHHGENIVGRKFGNWVVEKEDVASPTREKLWVCRCKCGNSSSVRGSALRDGSSQSCGCKRNLETRIRHTLIPRGTGSINIIFANYQRDAKRRNYDWTLSRDEFLEITAKPCTYCGSPPANRLKSKTGDFVYSGIDRVDNRKGYVAGNVAPCCALCNRLKYRMTAEELVQHAKKIYDHSLRSIDKA